MAIEVVVRGQLPSERQYQGTCWTCKTVAKWKQSDEKRHYNGDQRDPGRTSYIECPVCGKEMSGSETKTYGSGGYGGWMDR